ncbi:MAG: radical SAM protein [Planctomycetota bacterium]
MLSNLIRYSYKTIYNHYFGNIKSGKIRRFPSNIFVELTNICNLKCPICPSRNMKREKGYMDFELYKKIIDECSGYENVDIMLHMFGEPLLHKDLIKMMRYGKRYSNIKLAFSTNATLLDYERSKELIDAGLDGIHFSLDGFTKETYEAIRVGAQFERTVNNIKQFLELHRKSGQPKPVIEIQIIRTKKTRKELQGFVDYWRKEARGTPSIVSVKEYGTWGGLVDSEDIKRGILCRVPCASIKFLMGIYWNGDVIPCCIDPEGYLKMGEVRNNSLLSVWQGDAMRNFRNAHINEEFNKFPFCNNCESTYRYINIPFVRDVLKRQWFRLIGKKIEFLDIERK